MEIPVIHCFDSRYVPPAAVAFLSMLEHANPIHTYKLYVLHSDIAEDQQVRLREVVARFPNASLEFVDLRGRFVKAFRMLKRQAHYSTEMFYKLAVAELFPQYEKAIITDVDVLYRGDVSEAFLRFDVNGDDKDFYCAGVGYGTLNLSYRHLPFWKSYEEEYAGFTEKERDLLFGGGVGAGYLFFNLRKMREDRLYDKFVAYLVENAKRLVQPEQDVINLVCHPHIRHLEPRLMVCTYLWEWTTSEERESDLLKEVLANPVQVHFATAKKPWNAADCLFVDEWFGYLIRTPFLQDVLRSCQYVMAKKRKISARVGRIPIVRCKIKNGLVRLRLFGFIPLGSFSLTEHRYGRAI